MMTQPQLHRYNSQHAMTMKTAVAIFLIICGIVMLYWTYSRCRKFENKFSVGYFMCISGYGAGIGLIAIGVNMWCTM